MAPGRCPKHPPQHLTQLSRPRSSNNRGTQDRGKSPRVPLVLGRRALGRGRGTEGAWELAGGARYRRAVAVVAGRDSALPRSHAGWIKGHAPCGWLTIGGAARERPEEHRRAVQAALSWQDWGGTERAPRLAESAVLVETMVHRHGPSSASEEPQLRATSQLPHAHSARRALRAFQRELERPRGALSQ